jgi:hypothetical protein
LYSRKNKFYYLERIGEVTTARKYQKTEEEESCIKDGKNSEYKP